MQKDLVTSYLCTLPLICFLHKYGWSEVWYKRPFKASLIQNNRMTAAKKMMAI